jgi:hypothetical protein
VKEKTTCPMATPQGLRQADVPRTWAIDQAAFEGTRKIHGARPRVQEIQNQLVAVVEAGGAQALYACPERSRREPSTNASFLAWLHRFN